MTQSEHNSTDKFNDAYAAWKGWSDISNYNSQKRIFRQEVNRAGAPDGCSILEIGFGEGLFLEWGRDNGYEMAGIEINSEMANACRVRGHDIFVGTLEDCHFLKDRKWELIVLFDVLEHQSIDSITKWLSMFKDSITPTGKILARFPNGASPFGRLYQYGDATHSTVITASLLDQLCQLTGLKVEKCYNAARWKNQKDKWRLKNTITTQFIAYLIRDLIGASLSLIYFGKVVPFDPNLTVILTHK